MPKTPRVQLSRSFVRSHENAPIGTSDAACSYNSSQSGPSLLKRDVPTSKALLDRGRFIDSVSSCKVRLGRLDLAVAVQSKCCVYIEMANIL